MITTQKKLRDPRTIQHRERTDLPAATSGTASSPRPSHGLRPPGWMVDLPPDLVIAALHQQIKDVLGDDVSSFEGFGEYGSIMIGAITLSHLLERAQHAQHAPPHACAARAKR